MRSGVLALAGLVACALAAGALPAASDEPAAARGADGGQGQSGACADRIEGLKKALHLRGPMQQDGRTVWKIRGGDGRTRTLTQSDMSGPIDSWFDSNPLPHMQAYADVMDAIEARNQGDTAACLDAVDAAQDVLKEKATATEDKPG